MMPRSVQPETAEAIQELQREGLLQDPPASKLLRLARGQLVSIRTELRLLLYAGVLLATAGAGIWIREYARRIGPAAVTVILAAACAACFRYVLVRSAPFSREAVPSPTVAFDYVLLLGALLFGLDLAYVETQFRLLGPHWEFHLLAVSLVYLALAYRFDSSALLSLALSAFAAWRGVSSRHSLEFLLGSLSGRIRANAIACGVLFLAAAAFTSRKRWKAHFEGIWTNFGLILLFGGFVSGVFQGRESGWVGWEIALFGIAAAVLAVSLRRRKSVPFAVAVIAAHLGLLRLIFEVVRDTAAAFFLAAISSLLVLALVVGGHIRMKANRAR